MKAENARDFDPITHWRDVELPPLPPRFVWVAYAREPAVVDPDADEPWLRNYGWISDLDYSNRVRVRLTVVTMTPRDETSDYYDFNTIQEAVQYLATACFLGSI